jgi:hypothetical protein
MFVAVDPYFAFEEKIDCVLRASLFGDEDTPRILPEFENILPVVFAGGAVRIFVTPFEHSAVKILA